MRPFLPTLGFAVLLAMTAGFVMFVVITVLT
jgi:hypothetical protein